MKFLDLQHKGNEAKVENKFVNKEKQLTQNTKQSAVISSIDNVPLGSLYSCEEDIMKNHISFYININKILIFLTILFLPLILFAPKVSASDDLTQYAASYQLNWHGVSAGSSDHTLKKLKPNQYVAESISKPYLSIVPFSSSERSEFTLEDSMIKPMRYDFMTEEKGKNIIGFVDFDWLNHTLLKSIQHGPERNEPLTDGVQDRITYTLQLRLDLLNGKKDFSYTVIEPKKVKHYTFNIIGEEKITTPFGTFETTKLETVNDKGDRRTQIWLAKEFDYLLIKLVQYRNEALESEAVLKTLKVLSPKESTSKDKNSSKDPKSKDHSFQEQIKQETENNHPEHRHHESMHNVHSQ